MQRRELLGLAALGLTGCATTGVAPQAGPPPLPAAVSRIGFASCADQTRPQPMWDGVMADRPDLFVFGGDNVYSTPVPWSLEALRQAYALQAAEPHFARVRQAIPHLAIWDDNDYGANDGGGDFAFKHESKAAFLDFWNVAADDERRQREGLYHARTFGQAGQRVQVIVMDVRWARSKWKPTDQRNALGRERYVPDADPAKTMLGEAQWQWLEAQLRQPADVRVLVSGIQVVAEGHGWERWGNLPLERQRLYGTIGRARANGVVLLSGDRHFGALYRETGGTPYPLHEMTSSGITHPWREARESNPNRIGELFTEIHFGAVEIDWAARTVTLALKDMVGTTRRSLAVPLEDLRLNA